MTGRRWRAVVDGGIRLWRVGSMVAGGLAVVLLLCVVVGLQVGPSAARGRPVDATRFTVDATRFTVDATRFTVDATRFTVDATPFTAEQRQRATTVLTGATVRVSARACGRSVVGSGFLTGGLVVTNSHVVGPAGDFIVDRPASATVPGNAASLAPSGVAVAGNRSSVDLAFGRMISPLALETAGGDPLIGEPVLLAGFGGGRSLQIIEATVSNIVDGRAYGSLGPVVLIDRATEVGFSGGPVVNRHGEVVAVLRAHDRATGLTVAVPLSVMAEATRSPNMQYEEMPC